MKMKLKFATGIIALVLFLGVFVGAFTFTTSPTSLPTFATLGQTETISINSEGDFNVGIISNDNFDVNVVGNSTNTNFTELNINFSSLLGLTVGKINSVTLANIVNASDPDDLSPFNVNYVSSFCKSGSVNDSGLEINKVRIKNNGAGDKDEWQPLDLITVDVEFRNNLGDDLDDVILHVGLFKDGSSTNVIDDMDWISSGDEEYEVGDVDDGKRASHTFEFRVDPGDIEKGTYYFVVKAYPDGDENEFCIDYSDDLSDNYSEKIEVKKESNRDKMVVIDEESYPVLESTCNGNVEFNADVWNVGDKDFENQIKVNLFNNELGLNIDEVIVGDFDQGDLVKANFKFSVPQDAEEKTYLLSMRTYYDYDEDKEIYRRVSDKTFSAFLKVEGNCLITPPTVSAQLSAGEAKEGGQITIEVYLRNDDKKEQTFLIAPQGYASWATLSEVTPQTVTLKSGESQNVYITLDLKSNSRGEQIFDLIITSNNQIVVNSPVLVEVESGSFWNNFSSWDIDWRTWGIIALNVILLIAIIIVAVKILKRK